MALKPLQATMPLGQFDCVDGALTSFKGGEVIAFGQLVNTVATDKAAYDAFDGYANPNLRPALTRLGYTASGTISATTTASRPLMLADEGIAGYGTLFGTVVGGTVGQVSTGGAVLGPHTATGSGKVTAWSQPGLYAISIDACASDLQPTNASVDVGGAVYATVANDTTTSGVLTITSSSNVQVGNFVEFATNGSLVTTPNNLVGTFNPPDGALTTGLRSYQWAVIYFNV
jgi:hypothetical protein